MIAKRTLSLNDPQPDKIIRFLIHR